MRRREHGEGDRQVEAGALLSQGRGRKVHGDPVARPLQLGCDDAGAHTVLRLLARAVGEPDDGEAGQATLDARLDLHPSRVESDESVGDRAREHMADARSRT